MLDLRQLRQAIGERVIPAADLARALGVSRPTLARAVQRASGSVVRFGAARATRYAATRDIEGVSSGTPLRRIGESGRPEVLGVMFPLAGRAHAVVPSHGAELLYEGIPPFLDDMRPQGFLGRRFVEQNRDLGLPSRIQDWSGDHIFRALALRGEDCVGNLILGDASFDRWLALANRSTPRSDYPRAAGAVLTGEVGSSAGGEHPKFSTLSGKRHVLVKFADPDDRGLVTRRWRDLLACEELALRTLAHAGLKAPKAACFDVEGMRFLEVERFDRIGERGRRGVVSLGAWNNEYLGLDHRSWTDAILAMVAGGHLSVADARDVRWLDTFGELIANSDRHFWNVTFFWELGGRLELAPTYDMLPMHFAPGPTGVTDRPFEPAPPTSANVDVWPSAAQAAARFWSDVAKDERISKDFRKIAARSGQAVEARRESLRHLA